MATQAAGHQFVIRMTNEQRAQFLREYHNALQTRSISANAYALHKLGLLTDTQLEKARRFTKNRMLQSNSQPSDGAPANDSAN